MAELYRSYTVRVVLRRNGKLIMDSSGKPCETTITISRPSLPQSGDVVRLRGIPWRVSDVLACGPILD